MGIQALILRTSAVTPLWCLFDVNFRKESIFCRLEACKMKLILLWKWLTLRMQLIIYQSRSVRLSYTNTQNGWNSLDLFEQIYKLIYVFKNKSVDLTKTNRSAFFQYPNLLPSIIIVVFYTLLSRKHSV